MEDRTMYGCMCLSWDKEFPNKIQTCRTDMYYTLEGAMPDILKWANDYDDVSLQSVVPGENGKCKIDYTSKGNHRLLIYTSKKHSEKILEISVYIDSSKHDIDFIKNAIKDTETTGITSDEGYVIKVDIRDTRV